MSVGTRKRALRGQTNSGKVKTREGGGQQREGGCEKPEPKACRLNIKEAEVLLGFFMPFLATSPIVFVDV